MTNNKYLYYIVPTPHDLRCSEQCTFSQIAVNPHGQHNNTARYKVKEAMHFTYRRSKALQLRVSRALLCSRRWPESVLLTIGLWRLKKQQQQYRLHNTICGGFVKSRCSIVPIFRLFRLISRRDLTCNDDNIIVVVVYFCTDIVIL